MSKKLLLSIVLISIISGIIIAGCGDSGSSQIVVPATGTPTQIASLINIKGQALEVNGIPIPNAYVVCVNLGLSASLSTLADQLGNYIFKNLPPGTYRIEIWRSEGDHNSSPGSPIGAINITVTEGTITVNVTVGTIDPTPTPTATNTPGGPTNTPGGPTATNTPTPTATRTATATKTPGGPTDTPVPTPTITGFTPASGPIGTVVTINGSYFGSSPTVRFNGTQATGVSSTGTQITATVPTGATTGKITVTTTSGTATSTNDFTVTLLAWQVSDITMPAAASTILVDVHFVGTEGWIIGGMTSDNGNMYHIQEPNTVTSFSVSAVTPRKKIVASNGTPEWCNSLDMKDSSHVYAVTNLGYLLFYNGTGWTRKSTSSTGLSSIHFPSEGGNGYCCGSNSIDNINTSSPPDITTFAPSPGSLNYTDIFALSSSNIWVSWAGGNELLRYSGSGWTDKSGNLPSTATSIYFFDSNNGWVICDGGTIHKYNPGDEENWIGQSLPSGLGSSVLLRDLFFINSSEGWIVGSNDNHALILHTTDGGDTWNIQYNDLVIPSLNALYMTSSNKGYAVGYNNTVLIYK